MDRPVTLTKEDLLSNFKPIEGALASDGDMVIPMTYSDGQCGVILSRTREFITTPNCSSIPEPPIGSTRDLFRRCDARYGPDDPLCWPQPYNPRYAYLAAVPKPPTKPTDPYYDTCVMWTNVCEGDIEYTERGLRSKEGVLKQRIILELQARIDDLKKRVKVMLEREKDEELNKLVSELSLVSEICLLHISSISSSLRDLQRGYVELQRSWITQTALVDYVDVFHKRIQGEYRAAAEADVQKEYRAAAEVDGHRMGAFVWDDAPAKVLYTAGLPVYFVRPYGKFDRQVIRSVVPLTRPTAPPLELKNAMPPYLPIVMTNAGSDEKFLAIRTAALRCFAEPNPFQNGHFPGMYQSSYVLGEGAIRSNAMPAASSSASTSGASMNQSQPRKRVGEEPAGAKRRRGHGGKTVANPPKHQRNTFDDFPEDDPFAPSCIEAWKKVNLTIQRNGVSPKKKTFVVPEPGMFFELEDMSRQPVFLAQWKQVREAWLRRMKVKAVPEPMEIWRKLLALPFIGIEEEGNVPALNKHQEDVHKVRELVNHTMKTYGDARAPVVAPKVLNYDVEEGKRLICELCLINFRYELTSADEALDSRRPKPTPAMSQAALEHALVLYDQKRAKSFGFIFGGGATTSGGTTFEILDISLNLGITSTEWEERYRALKSFWFVMDTWPLPKLATWRRGIEMDMSALPVLGKQWERMLAEYYVQSVYNILGRPPTLPRRLSNS